MEYYPNLDFSFLDDEGLTRVLPTLFAKEFVALYMELAIKEATP